HYAQVQFGWLFAGLCGRILFFNADRAFLAAWLLFTIGAAVLTGYLYGGKSWCQYLCPMAPVQQIYSEPGGLLGSPAHTSDQLITQSMCRVTLPEGQEQSACVACQNPCIDIDAERAYWEGLPQPEAAGLRYGYVGLVLGYFLYYYLYAGNWTYYFSGYWARDPDQLATLLSPGLYLGGYSVPIPKLVAVPLTLGGFTWAARAAGRWIERQACQIWEPHCPSQVIRHRLFTVSTFAIFNIFFIFGGRPLVQLWPLWVQYIYDLGLVLLSTLWLAKTWGRTPERYAREGLANRFRRQLTKLGLTIGQYLEGRTLADLNTDEVYVLAKVLPGFTREKRLLAYKGVLQEALAEGYVNYASSLQVLQQLRQELGITEDDHREVLDTLGVEDPELLNPDRQRTQENLVRLNGYRQSLERLMRLQQQQPGTDLAPILEPSSDALRHLRRQYGITVQEEQWILGNLAPETCQVRRGEYLLTQLPRWIAIDRALHQPALRTFEAPLTLLREAVHHKKELMVRALLDILVGLGEDPAGRPLATALSQCCPAELPLLLETEDWANRLADPIYACLTQLEKPPAPCALDATPDQVTPHLLTLVTDRNPLVQAAGLYVLAHLDPDLGRDTAAEVSQQNPHPLVADTAGRIQAGEPGPMPLSDFPILEKVVYLANADFFQRMHNETLLALAERAEIRTYANGDAVTEPGDTCRELLLLVAGAAEVQAMTATGDRVRTALHPGQTLDELEVLAHSESQNRIVVTAPDTRILAVPVAAFDDLLAQDPDFARRVLALESRQLQRFIHSFQGATV
ncbi:MAG: cyclic nucleotide-binding domain-containing protein, partial [Gloeomargaritaceae cyanobacterium C42_A2020_066]|nr:cyclic nucleotide-binding domain-containing protein [Gloeomargaritaceae cyanobacterium C42_A2020_066]